MNKRTVLGKGLGALIRETAAPSAAGPYLQCPVDQIRPNPEQPRKNFHDGSLHSLADTVRERGVIQPLLVRRAGQGYEIIAGERRWRAAKLAGLKEVPVVVREASDGESLEMALIENLHREDLDPIEQAQGYQRLIEEMGYTQERLAHQLGKDRTTLTNTLRLLHLAPAVRRMVAEGTLSPGHARPLLAVSDPQEQAKLAREVLNKRLSVREVESLIREGAEAAQPERDARAARGGRPAGAASPEIRDIERKFREALMAPVHIVTTGRAKGKIEIRYQSLEDFDRIAERILGDERIPRGT